MKLSKYFSALFLSFTLMGSALESKKEVDLIVLGGMVVTMDADRSIIQKGALAIDKGEIVAIGSQEEIDSAYLGNQSIDAKGKAIIPGLINGHAHTPMTLFRGLADDLELNDWLFNYMFPAEARNVDEEFIRAGTRLGVAEMIRGGTTMVLDMYFYEDEVADEAAKAGMRGFFGYGLIDFPAPDNKTFDEAIVKAETFLEKWKGHPLISPGLAPHSPYTISEEHLKAISALSKKAGAPIFIHVSETQGEVEQSTKEKGLSPILFLDRIGFLDTHVVAAHVVYANAEELAILKKRNVGVIHNPQSNMKLASGIAPIPKMLLAGIDVGIGTDGAASNNDLSIWEEMDSAAKLHKVANNSPTALRAQEAFELATIRGAKALRMEKEIGSLEVGKKADIAIVDLDGLHQIPSYNIYSTLIYATKASDVSTVIIDGKIVMQDRKLLTLDEKSIKEQAARYRDQVIKSLKQETK